MITTALVAIGAVIVTVLVCVMVFAYLMFKALNR